MIRVGKPMAQNTFVVYVGTEIKEVVYAESRSQAGEWAQRKYGSNAYIFENVQALDITWG
ncbi:hypothetical protein [Paenibacillus polymyxa]|uniref:hypothetical protein n=1 Tax=Paenibacillus polymyxa TaxID=1406 RepID=UPI0006C43A7F|nr:hypothetical protein [Paenibacillus polymyxa]KOS00440.1 hypothetical protein AM598_22845 [Paenibacillus polymyxa]